MSAPGIRVYHADTDADSSTVANALTLAKDYSVTVRRHSCMLVKKLYAFYWVLKKEKTLNELRVRKYYDKISGLTHGKA